MDIVAMSVKMVMQQGNKKPTLTSKGEGFNGVRHDLLSCFRKSGWCLVLLCTYWGNELMKKMMLSKQQRGGVVQWKNRT